MNLTSFLRSCFITDGDSCNSQKITTSFMLNTVIILLGLVPAPGMCCEIMTLTVSLFASSTTSFVSSLKMENSYTDYKVAIY